MSNRILPFTVSFAIALTACMAGEAPPIGGGDDTTGGGDDGTGGGGGPAGFITAFSTQECQMAHGCKAEFPADAGVTFEQAFGADVAACVTMATQFYQPDAVSTAVTAGRITYDASAATACIQNLDFGTCAQYFAGTSPLPTSCGQALIGHVADGGTCTVDLECSAQGSWCGDAGACEPVPMP